MEKVSVSLNFSDSGYIGQPYWPELATLININKDVHPKLGDSKKQAAITAALEKRGLTWDDYNVIKEKAARPFYTVDETRNGEIVIPQRVIQSFVNNCSMNAPKAIPKISSKGLTFIGLKVEEGFLRTKCTELSALKFERFVKMEESNQRAFSSSLYITNFNATGVFILDEEIIPSKDLQKIFEWGGKYIGLGSARPQGYGRFKVIGWDLVSSLKEAA